MNFEEYLVEAANQKHVKAILDSAKKHYQSHKKLAGTDKEDLQAVEDDYHELKMYADHVKKGEYAHANRMVTSMETAVREQIPHDTFKFVKEQK